MKEQVERAVKEGRLKPSEGVKLLDDYEAGMKEYTYLDCNGQQPAADTAPPPVVTAKPQRKDRERPANGDDRSRGEAEHPEPSPDVAAAPASGRSD